MRVSGRTSSCTSGSHSFGVVARPRDHPAIRVLPGAALMVATPNRIGIITTSATSHTACPNSIWLSSGSSRPDLVEMAIWFHDIINEPGRSDNEARSADSFRNLAGGSMADAFIAEVVDLILITTHRQEAVDPDQRILCDIDLASLGCPWETLSARHGIPACRVQRLGPRLLPHQARVFGVDAAPPPDLRHGFFLRAIRAACP